jgi:hypothetical protein
VRGDVSLDRPLPSTPAQLPTEWSSEDVAVDLASNRRTDPAVGTGLMSSLPADQGVPIPAAVHPGAVVLVPELDPALPLTAHAEVRAAGYEILTQPGVRHVMHRDDLHGFLDLLRTQVGEGGVAA